MKRAWMLGAAAAIVFSYGCESQKPELAEDFGDLAGVDQKSDKFSSKMKIVGSLDYGQTSAAVKYHNPQLYRAFKFGGSAGDQVVVDVTSKTGDAVAWVVTDSFKVVAKNDDSNGTLNSHIEATLPANSDGTITYYIIFTEYWSSDATFVVSLAQKQACVQKQFCIQGAHWDSTQCKCVTDQQMCGGIAGIRCPAGQKCVDDATDSCDPANGGADCPGVCVQCFDNVLCANGYHWDQASCGCVAYQTCGGIAGIACPTGFNCVDNPNDNCDPAHGGADCGGICVSN
jgi:hypothetical protein